MRRRTRKEKVLAAIDPSSCLRPVLSQGPPSPFPTTPQMTGEGPWKFLCHRILLCKYLHTITGSVVVVVWPLLPLMRTHLFTFLYSFLSLSLSTTPPRKKKRERNNVGEETDGTHHVIAPRVCYFFLLSFSFCCFPCVYSPHPLFFLHTDSGNKRKISLSPFLMAILATLFHSTFGPACIVYSPNINLLSV